MSFEAPTVAPQHSERDDDDEEIIPRTRESSEASSGIPIPESAAPFRDIDPRELLSQLVEGRNPTEEIDVEGERERIKDRLETVGEALHAEGSAGRSASPEAKTLEEVQQKLQAEDKKLDVAEEFNEVLDKFSTLDEGELRTIAETGLDKNGKKIEHNGKHLNSKIAKELAHLASGGVKRLTWGALKEAFALVDAVLNDVFYPLKKMMHLEG